MSFSARDWAQRQTTGSAAAKAVLNALAAFADHGDGTLAFPSLASIEAMTELNRKTIIAAIGRLESINLIAATGKLRTRVKEYRIGPQRVAGLGNLGEHAVAASSTENGTRRETIPPTSSTVFTRVQYQKRDTDSVLESKIEARAREPVDNSTGEPPQKKEMLGEGSTLDHPSQLPAGDPVADVYAAWDEMESSHGLPGPVVRDAVRTAAIEAKVASAGLPRVLAVIAAVGVSDTVTRPAKRGKRGQADWRSMFDEVFAVGRRYRGSATFARLLAVPGALLPPDPEDELAAEGARLVANLAANREAERPPRQFAPAAGAGVRPETLDFLRRTGRLAVAVDEPVEN